MGFCDLTEQLTPSCLISLSHEVISQEIARNWLMFELWAAHVAVHAAEGFCPCRNCPIHTIAPSVGCSWRFQYKAISGKRHYSYFCCLNSKGLSHERINWISNNFSGRILPFHITSVNGIIKAIIASPLHLGLIALKIHHRKSSRSTAFLKLF